LFQSSFKRLKEIGVKFSLDDFGKGYSSLMYLHKFMVDTIKIDQYFFKNLLNSHGSITKHIINLAHELNMNVIAEGVETKEQLEFLMSVGCNQVQGFLLSQPIPKEKVEKLLLLNPY